jgi:hypothetical protein
MPGVFRRVLQTRRINERRAPVHAFEFVGLDQEGELTDETIV